jgi:hypothetical protein
VTYYLDFTESNTTILSKVQIVCMESIEQLFFPWNYFRYSFPNATYQRMVSPKMTLHNQPPRIYNCVITTQVSIKAVSRRSNMTCTKGTIVLHDRSTVKFSNIETIHTAMIYIRLTLLVWKGRDHLLLKMALAVVDRVGGARFLYCVAIISLSIW